MGAYGDYRVSIFGRDGVGLDELDCAFTFGMAMNKTGTSELRISNREAKCRKSLLKTGNLVLFEHARLGDWGGVFSFESGEEWTGNNELVLKPYSAEYQLSRRRGPLYNKKDYMLDLTGPIGEAFRTVLGFANAEEDTRIRPGRIYGGARKTLVQLRDARCDKVMEKIVKKSGFDFWMEPGRDEHNRLIFLANLVERRGDTTGYALQEGINLETPTGTFYRRDGRLVNDMAVRNNGAEDGGLIRKVAFDEASRNEYGLWQDASTVNTDSELMVQVTADDTVRENAWPREVFKLTAIETPESPDTFARIHLGDVVHVSLHSVGFWYNTTGVDADVRIMAMEYSTVENKVILTSEVVR